MQNPMQSNQFNGLKHIVVAVNELSPSRVPIYYLYQYRS